MATKLSYVCGNMNQLHNNNMIIYTLWPPGGGIKIEN